MPRLPVPLAATTLVASLRRRLQRFIGVGAVGVAVDAAIFFVATAVLGAHFAVGRIVATLVALTTTWRLNRVFTFAGRPAHRAPVEFLRYLGASAIGAAANLAVMACIAPFDASLAHVPAYIMGAAAGLVVNFLLYDKLVFRHGSIAKPDDVAVPR